MQLALYVAYISIVANLVAKIFYNFKSIEFFPRNCFRPVDALVGCPESKPVQNFRRKGKL